MPAVLAKVLEAGPDAVKLFGALKTYAYGASPMPLPLLREALQALAGHRLHPGVRADRGVRVWSRRLGPEDHRGGDEERMISAGTPIPGVEVRVVDPDTLQDVAAGTQGELWFRTAQLMKGYLNRPEDTAEADHRGRLVPHR